MSSRVKLYFETFTHKILERKIKHRYEIIRLKASVRLKTLAGWSKIYDAIVDTGAHTSVIPFSIWKKLKIKRIATHEMQGLSVKPECSIPVIVGIVSCVLVDEAGNKTEEKKIHAYLALTDEVPLILGFKDLLSRFKIECDYENKYAFIKTKER